MWELDGLQATGKSIWSNMLVAAQTIKYQASKIIIHNCTQWFFGFGTYLSGTHQLNAFIHLSNNGPLPFQMGSAFQGCITQETWTSTGQQQTKIICFWTKPWICHLVQSVAHFLECRTQLIRVLCHFQECGCDTLIQWRVALATIPFFIIKGSPEALPIGRWVLWKHFK